MPIYFVDEVRTEGISRLNPDDIESVHVWKDAEAIARYGEEGRNGVVSIYTKKYAAAKGMQSKPVVSPVKVRDTTKQPLYIVDGKEVSAAALNVRPDYIKSINVLKDAAATAKYGEKAVNGVVLIETSEKPVRPTPRP